MIGTGLRIFEVEALCPAQINWTTKILNVVGKGEKPRGVPIRAGVEQILRDQLADRKERDGRTVRSNDPLFVLESSRSTSMRQYSFYHQAVRRIFMEAAEECQIPPFAPHDCRRTFGTRCAEKGVPMKTLQAWMGHANISTTAEFYVHLNSDANRAIDIEGLNLE